jgi:prepilin-type N-terminal cleavage/methylation domain-containing protein
MKRTIRQDASQGGFTMIEIIAVFVIIAIIAAVAVSRMSNTNDYNRSSKVQAVKGHLRYAQTRAMNSNQVVWGIYFYDSTHYYLFQGVMSTTAVRLPGENSGTINLAANNSGFAITSTTPMRITFNEFGSPFLDTATTSSTITIATNGGNITVTQNTGFMP